MPNPAFEKLKQTVVGAVRVGEKAARTAAPVVRRAAGDLRTRFARPDDAAPPPPAPVASTKAAATKATQAPKAPSAKKARTAKRDPAAPAPDTPTPASIAKNVPHQRPVAKPPARKRAAPSDSPGGKLPPRR